MTVGTQLPFERLVKAVDDWAITNQYFDIVFQVGKSSYQPRVGKKYDFLAVDEMDDLVAKAKIIVSHAGTGTIFNCLSIGKPMVMLPRRFKYDEHRNDHQWQTFLAFKEMPGIYAAEEEDEVARRIEDALLEKSYESKIGAYADEELLDFLRAEINFV
ncbi:glycosyltransferase [Microbulbifer aggregans]|uniref:glycosyltransferase n=1 Tax=Microbulbifer aggregans TaxID=1769779 RepID=UPI001314D2F2|nr:glycosyltransferase [Microbulbifer aggregans]